MRNRPENVAVVIPAKNEAERIEASIAGARGLTGVDLVVVVDDGSTDATAAVAMGAGALVVRHKSNRGKAAAMATGAQMVAMREEADRADGGEGFSEELHAEPREPGHTGPLPVIDGDRFVPRALLFIDADMGESAPAAQPLVDAVLEDGVDMAIALLPPQEGAGGFGLVVRTARNGIQRATGWEPTQPLSGTRCITRETWEACQPIAPGWGVETSLTIDALSGGFWVKEVDCDLRHRATGRDLRGQLHRAAQLRDVLRALARRRHLHPGIAEDTLADDPSAEEASDPAAEAQEPGTDLPEPEEKDAWSMSEDDPAARAQRRRLELQTLPVAGFVSDDLTRMLGDVDVERLRTGIQELPVDGPFDPEDLVLLAETDLAALAGRLRGAPVDGPFSPAHALIIASHLDVPEPELPASISPPISPEEFTSLVVHAAVEAENAEHPEDPIP